MKFTTFQNWLSERAAERLSYGCLMMEGDVPDWKEKISIVKEEDLYIKDDDFGYEKEPHVTILYGFHDDEIDQDEMDEEIKKMIPVSVSIDNISIFEHNDKFDVVKYEVPVTSELKTYHKTFMKKFPNTQTFRGYHPHMTIAYVKKGEGKKYIQKVKRFQVKFNKAIYSTPDCDKKIFKL